MKKEDIKLSDFYRLINGEVPYEFYIELIIRTLFVYLVLTFGMRLVGKRLSSEITRSELAAMSTLAAATGLVILAPDRGLLPPLIVIGVIAAMQYYLHKGAMKSNKFEYMTEGHLTLLVNHGVLQLKPMQDARVSRFHLFSELRGLGIKQLGAVKRLYFEADGSFSLVQEEQPRPGLTVLPEWDTDFIKEQEFADEMVCSFCGKPLHGQDKLCVNCSNTNFEKGMKGS